jgi:hypothetical protein
MSLTDLGYFTTREKRRMIPARVGRVIIPPELLLATPACVHSTTPAAAAASRRCRDSKAGAPQMPRSQCLAAAKCHSLKLLR